VSELVSLGALDVVFAPVEDRAGGGGGRGAQRQQQQQQQQQREELTPLGTHLSTLPVDARIGKLILFGAMFGVADEVSPKPVILNPKPHTPHATTRNPTEPSTSKP